MKIFIDTADLDEIEEANTWGIVDGITTNPSLIKKAVDRRTGKMSMKEYLIKMITSVQGPVSLEVIAFTEDEMVKQAEALYREFNSYGNVVIKIPVNPDMDNATSDFDGLKAIKRLYDAGIPVNATLIMTPEQALLAAKAGAAYASPFAGRIDDHIRAKIGLKRGIDYPKGAYFDSLLLQKIINGMLSEYVYASNILGAYTDGNLNTLIDSRHDNGIVSGVELIQQTVQIYQHYGFHTEIIAASLRNARQVREVANIGVDIATIPFNVIVEMIQHPKTNEGMKAFTRDIVPAYKTLFKELANKSN
jgi:transaldolase